MLVAWGTLGMELWGQSPGSAGAESLPVLTNATQIAGRSPGNVPHPIRLRAVVTYYDPQWPILFVQDDTVGLYVPAASNLSLATSNQIELVGTVLPGGRIAATSLSVVAATAPWPVPRPTSVEELDSGARDKRYVAVRGTLLSLGEERHHYVLQLRAANHRPFRALIRKADLPRTRLADWLAAQLEVRGVCGSWFNAQGTIQGYQLWLPGPEHVRVLAPPVAGAFSTNQVKIATAKLTDLARLPFEHLTVEGVVTWQESPTELYLEDDTGGLNVHLREPAAFPAGTRVEVSGLPNGDYCMFYLDHTVARAKGVGPAPPAANLSARQVMTGHYWSMLVSVAGYVLNTVTNGTEVHWLVQGDGVGFIASLDKGAAPATRGVVREGYLVRFAGVCLPKRDPNRIPRSFEIALRSPADAALVAGTAWIRLRGALPLVAGAGALASLAGVWALTLRHQVGRQTRRLREQLARETALEQRFRNLFESASDLVYTYDFTGRLTSVNQRVETLTGYSRQEALRLSAFDWVLPEHQERVRDALRRQTAGAERVAFPVTLLAKAGHRLQVEVSTCFVYEEGRPSEVLAIARDVTERQRADAALRSSLEEKTILLKEVHHRVKNNLQIITSLLSLQAGRQSSGEILAALRDTQNRVRSMATLHETLYRSASLARLDIVAYIRNLCVQVHRSFGPEVVARVHLEPRLVPLTLSLDQAVPCGLIINELVSNALKHAFPPGRSGRIIVELQAGTGHQAVLIVADDGLGLPPQFELKQSRTLGLNLVNGLAAQLDGHLEARPRGGSGGSLFQLTFPIRRNSESTPTESDPKPGLSPTADGPPTSA